MAVIEQMRDTNGYPFTREQIGTLKITAGVVRHRHYEVAAWWTKIAVDAGTYPVYRTRSPRSTRSHVYVTVPGTVVDEYMPALFAGVPMTSGYRNTRIGQRTTLIIDGCEYEENPFARADGMTFTPIPEHAFR